MKAAATFVGVVWFATVFAMAGMASAAEEGAVYLWVDKDGTPHYQDRPPEGTEASKELPMRYKLTDGQTVAAANKQKSELSDAAQNREKQQAEDKTAEDQDKEKVASEREQACEQAKARLQKYDTAHRLYKPGPDGKRTYLTDEETDAARAEARRTKEEWCGE